MIAGAAGQVVLALVQGLMLGMTALLALHPGSAMTDASSAEASPG